MSGIPTRSLAQLPLASSVSTNDITVIQQSGITKQANLGLLLASAQIPSVLLKKEDVVEKKEETQNKEALEQTNKDKPVFKIQILTSSSSIPTGDKRFKGLENIGCYQEGGLFKYTYSASTDYNLVLKTKRDISSLFKDAFIIAFKNEQKMNINEAISEFKKGK